jgi:large subunit ribosomal protein L15
MCDPLKFFQSGKPIPRNDTPPLNSIEFYTSACNRGYLANPEHIRLERLKLAQKYGYDLPDLSGNEMFAMKKDPRQCWYGLEPGWVVNLVDKCVLKPVDEELLDYYRK